MLQDIFHFVSLQEFFADGFVLVVAIFIGNIIERVVLWTTQYRLVIESVHTKAVLQVRMK